MSLTSVELFAGAGGLALGVALAGFRSVAVVEWDRWACDTLRENQARGFPLVKDWPVHEGDVREWIDAFDVEAHRERLDLVAGGPPCQPFSLGGRHRAHLDHRDMFPVTIDVIRRLRPRAFIVENVRGLTRAAFHNYFEFIKLHLEFPEESRRPDESWGDHLRRLERHKTSRRVADGLRYHVFPHLTNAASYGVAQRRERVFIVGFRSDAKVDWSFPIETHSLDALLHDQWVTGAYWDWHQVPKRARPTSPPHLRATIDRLRGLGLLPMHARWRTVRDALVGLPDPELGDEGPAFLNHRHQPGARPYPGHTGSPIDLPAKTLKAGDHGVPGGENMLVRLDGRVRYFTARESARLQAFPDGFALHGSWSEVMRQLGNAVPVTLARTVAASVAERLLALDTARLLSRQPAHGTAFAG
jgi:DNA (cytosine-5)-methyltransferase 1